MTEPCKNLAKPLQNLFQGGTIGASPVAYSPLESSFKRFHLYGGGDKASNFGRFVPFPEHFKAITSRSARIFPWSGYDTPLITGLCPPFNFQYLV